MCEEKLVREVVEIGIRFEKAEVNGDEFVIFEVAIESGIVEADAFFAPVMLFGVGEVEAILLHEQDDFFFFQGEEFGVVEQAIFVIDFHAAETLVFVAIKKEGVTMVPIVVHQGVIIEDVVRKILYFFRWSEQGFRIGDGAAEIEVTETFEQAYLRVFEHVWPKLEIVGNSRKFWIKNICEKYFVSE